MGAAIYARMQTEYKHMHVVGRIIIAIGAVCSLASCGENNNMQGGR